MFASLRQLRRAVPHAPGHDGLDLSRMRPRDTAAQRWWTSSGDRARTPAPGRAHRRRVRARRAAARTQGRARRPPTRARLATIAVDRDRRGARVAFAPVGPRGDGGGAEPRPRATSSPTPAPSSSLTTTETLCLHLRDLQLLRVDDYTRSGRQLADDAGGDQSRRGTRSSPPRSTRCARQSSPIAMRLRRKGIRPQVSAQIGQRARRAALLIRRAVSTLRAESASYHRDMAERPELSPRKTTVLHAIVEAYVATGRAGRVRDDRRAGRARRLERHDPQRDGRRSRSRATSRIPTPPPAGSRPTPATATTSTRLPAPDQAEGRPAAPDRRPLRRGDPRPRRGVEGLGAPAVSADAVRGSRGAARRRRTSTSSGSR